MFLRALREVAGEAAEQDVAGKIRTRIEEVLQDRPFAVVEVAVTKMGRTYFVVPYLNPEGPVEAEELDTLREELESACRVLLGEANAELIVTAKKPY